MSFRARQFMDFKLGMNGTRIDLMEPLQKLEHTIIQVAQLPTDCKDTGLLLHALQKQSSEVLEKLRNGKGVFPRPPEAILLFTKAMTQADMARKIAVEIATLKPSEAMPKHLRPTTT